MKKDIGIVTWHYYDNYGSALQAYALQTTIYKLGYTCEFINYRKFKSNNIKIAIKYMLSHLLDFIPLEKRGKYSYKFIQFQYDYLKQSKKTYIIETLKKYNTKYRIFISGSDQIWAPNVFDPIYFLSFVSDEKPKIAYAPSIGLNSIPDSLHNQYCKLLSRFNCLSVREENGAELIKSIVNLEAEVVLDPTLLLGKKDWEELAIKPKTKEDYILCYFLGDNKSHRESAKRVAERLKYKTIFISNYEMDGEIADYVDKYAGPREFLGYVRNAKFIVTDSFHGVVFSIIFNKNFYVFERFSNNNKICQNSRINNILYKVDLKDRLICYEGFIREINEIDYKCVDLLLKAERTKSLKYLKDSISRYI